uniref:Putative ovule protein n=1 Tax=Solanum chacoense TaxID=4108 RepID=A0A0V0GYN7_SOLCH
MVIYYTTKCCNNSKSQGKQIKTFLQIKGTNKTVVEILVTVWFSTENHFHMLGLSNTPCAQGTIYYNHAFLVTHKHDL